MGYNSGAAFTDAVRKFLCGQQLILEPEFKVELGHGVRRKAHRFDLGAPGILVECKDYTWLESGNSASGMKATLNEAILQFMAAPGGYRKMLFVPKSDLRGVRRPETFLQNYLRQHGHLIPASVEIWEYDRTTQSAERIYA